MVRQVCDRVFVSGCGVVDLELVVVSECVDDSHVQVSRIAFFTVLAEVSQNNCRSGRRLHLVRGPDDFIEAFDAAVQMVLTVVRGELVFDAVEREATFGNAVAVAADDRAEVRIVF